MSQINVDLVSPQSGADVTIDGNLIVTGTNNIRPYKVYSALLTQTGTSAPVATVLENTLGFVDFQYISPGSYQINSPSLFVTDKTSIDGNNVFNQNGETIAYRVAGVSFCQIQTRDSTGNQADDILYKNFVEIRVYNS